jgi:hypothetical protein
MIPDLLFRDFDLGQTLRNQDEELQRLINISNPLTIKDTPLDDLVQEYKDKLEISLVVLHEDQITIKQEEKEIDISQDRSKFIPDRSRPFFQLGTLVTYFIPFSGDPNLLRSKPSNFDFNPPRCVLKNQEILVQFQDVNFSPDFLKNEFRKVLESIKRYVEWINKDLVNYNTQLERKLLNLFEIRKKIIQTNEDLTKSLEFPVRKPTDFQDTYSVPITKKKVFPSITSSSNSGTSKPELDIKYYEEILITMTNMSTVMEKSPRSFSTMDEEALRDHFLVQLNGLYGGGATGETFNYQGKTDILIKHEGKNIFIAECKFWGGGKKLLETIDQLLSYTSWRDTKTAILIFNRNKNFSRVLAEIPKTTISHPNYVRTLEKKGETTTRYIFRHIDDIDRNLMLSILAFDIPKDD